MIRYRAGDLLRAEAGSERPAEAAGMPGLEPATTCPCGRPLPVLPGVMGRAGDTLELPDGRRINANLPSYIFKKHGKADTIREYQFVQYPQGRIVLRITTGPNWRDTVRGELDAEVRKVLGLSADLEIVPRIERRGRGKHRDFIRADGADPKGTP
jgi:phenylacetate-CoA ligase